MNEEEIKNLILERDKYKNHLKEIIKEHSRPHEDGLYAWSLGTLIEKIIKEL